MVNSSGNTTTTNSKYISDADLSKKIHDKLDSGWFTKGYEQVTVQVYNGNVQLGGSVDTQSDREKVEREVRAIDGVKNVDSQINVLNASNNRTLADSYDNSVDTYGNPNRTIDNPSYNRDTYGNSSNRTANPSYNREINSPRDEYNSNRMIDSSNRSYDNSTNRLSDNANSSFRNSNDRFAQDKGATVADQQLNRKIRDKVSSGILWDSYTEIALNTNNGVITLEGSIKNAREQQNLINKIQKIEGVRSVVSNLRLQE